MIRFHNKLRNKLSWYRQWQNSKYSTQIHFIFLFGIIFVISGIYVLKLDFVSKKKDSDVIASSSNNTLTTQANWQAGTNDGTDLITTPADIKISTESAKLDLLPIYNNDNNTITATTNSANRSLAIDNDPGTFWNVTTPYGESNSWTIDITSSHTFAFLTLISAIDTLGNGPFDIQYSLDNVVYSPLCSTLVGGTGPYNIADSSANGNCTGTHPFDARYIKLLSSTDMPDAMYVDIFDLELYETRMSATHTSASTQIGSTGDATRYVSEYETFTPTESEPANSDITYRFRLTTSGGGSTGTWTDYFDYIGTAIDLANQSALDITQTEIDAGKTYLQVETKFVRTDVAANPTLSDYTASFHTNKAPNAPTPQ